MHLSEKVIRQPSIVVEATQVRATHIADLQFLMARRTGRILEILQIPLATFLLLLCRADFM